MSFMKKRKNHQSLVTQMIMGSGKTTVVGPLLVLLLADGDQAVVQVCGLVLVVSAGVRPGREREKDSRPNNT